MTRLGSVLTEAAEDAPIGFEVDDIRRRVGQRRRRRTVGGSVAFLVVVASVALAFTVEQPDDQVEAIGGATQGINVVGRWTPIAYSNVTTGAIGAYLEFDEDGGFKGFNGCNGFSGAWRLDDDRLRVGDIVENLNACSPETVVAPMAALLSDRPTVSRFDGQADTLQLSSPSGYIAFERNTDPTEPTETSTAGAVVQATWTEATEVEPGRLQLTLPCQYASGESFDHTQVEETDTTVTVDLYVRIPTTGARPCDDQPLLVDVDLIDPVGTRQVTQSPRASPELP